MKILNIIASLDRSFGGPIDGALQLADLWAQQGHESIFATLDHPDAPYLTAPHRIVALGRFGGPEMASGKRLHFIERVGYSPAMVAWLRAHVGEFDAVLVHGLWNFATLAARRVLLGAGVPYAVFPHGCLDPWFAQAYPLKHRVKQLAWRFSEGPLLNAADAVLFTTEEEATLADGSFRPYRPRPAVVGFGSAQDGGDPAIQAARFRTELPALGGRPFLLYLSRIHPKKGADLLIDSFAAMAGDHPELDLVIAGPDSVGWQASLEERGRRLGVNARIHWPGMVTGDVKWGAFHACEAFVLPSHSENFGIVVAEALACARPVLITERVNLWREVEAGGAGLVAPDTASGIDALLHRFLALDETTRETMRCAARDTYERCFRFETTAARILALFAALPQRESIA